MKHQQPESTTKFNQQRNTRSETPNKLNKPPQQILKPQTRSQIQQTPQQPETILKPDSSQYNNDDEEDFNDADTDTDDDDDEETEFIWEGVLYTKLKNNTVINPRTMKSCGLWQPEIQIIEFNDEEDEENHMEQKQ